MNLFYQPVQPEDLIARLLRMADNGSSADYPEDWFNQEQEEFGEPWSPVPKYQPGDEVAYRSSGGSGTILEVEQFEGGWWYRVKNSDGSGNVQAPEEALHRPEGYDQPGEATIGDWMDIPPTAEQYYRTAGEDSWGEMFQPGYNGTPEKPFPFIYSPRQKQIHWGPRGGLHDHIGDELARQGQRIPQDGYYGRYYPAKDSPDGNDVYIYDRDFHGLPWRYQQAVYNHIRMNAPDKP